MSKITADLVTNGDFLPGHLGYVIDVETTDVSAPTGRYNVSLGEMTVITFNDDEGEENYLIVAPSMEIDIPKTEHVADPTERSHCRACEERVYNDGGALFDLDEPGSTHDCPEA